MKKFRVTKYLLICSLMLSSFLFGLSTAGAGTLLIGNVLSNSVTLFDEATLKPLKEIAVGYMPHEIVVSPNGELALVANFGDIFGLIPGHSLAVIDVLHAVVIKTIELPPKSRPHGIAFINDEEALVTAQGVQALFKINLKNDALTKLALPGAGAHMVITDALKQFAYVASTASGTISKIDLGNFAVIANNKVGKEAEGLSLTPQEKFLLVTDRKDNYVAVINPKNLSLIKKIRTQSGPVRVVMFANGNKAVVTNTVSGNVQIIDMATFNISQTFKTNTSFNPLPVPINIFVSDQWQAYITNFFADNIVLIDLHDGQILKTFKAGLMPDGVAVSAADVKDKNMQSYTSAEFSDGPLSINADIETVWQIVKNVNDYYRLSHGAINAHIDPPIALGKKIILQLYKDQWIGKYFPLSEEKITVVDEENKIVSWARALPDGSFTARYQHLEKIGDHQTLSMIVLRIPGLSGWIVKKTFGYKIDEAFHTLNQGIKNAAEQTK